MKNEKIDILEKAFRISKKATAINTDIKKFKSELSQKELQVIYGLSKLGKASAKSLSKATAIHGPSISRLTKALEKKKCIKVNKTDSDRRGIIISATAKGIAILSKFAIKSNQEVAK